MSNDVKHSIGRFMGRWKFTRFLMISFVAFLCTLVYIGCLPLFAWEGLKEGHADAMIELRDLKRGMATYWYEGFRSRG